MVAGSSHSCPLGPGLCYLLGSETSASSLWPGSVESTAGLMSTGAAESAPEDAQGCRGGGHD